MKFAPDPYRFKRLRLPGAFLVAACAVHASANTFTVVPDISGGFGRYKWSIKIDDAAAAGNPDLTLYTGQTYTFSVNTSSIHPFWIETAAGLGGTSPYEGDGLSDNGVGVPTTITFSVPNDAPDTLYYACGNHGEMHGIITVIVDPVFSNGFDTPIPAKPRK